MKFVTVMDMWLLILNGILLASILYYGRRLINLVARSVNKQDEKSIHEAVDEERKRIQKIIEKELSIFKTALTVGDGDQSFKPIVEELEIILREIKK